MPLLKPSKTVSRRIKRPIPPSFHPPDLPFAPAPLSVPPSKIHLHPSSMANTASPLKERVVRVICTDPDATDSSSDEEAEEEDVEEVDCEEEDVEGEQRRGEAEEVKEEGEDPIPQIHKRRRFVQGICFPSTSTLASDGCNQSSEICEENEENPHTKKKKKTRMMPNSACQQGNNETTEVEKPCENAQLMSDHQFFRLFPSDLFPFPDIDGGDDVWDERWVLPEDDAIFNDVGLNFEWEGTPWPPVSAEAAYLAS